MKTYKNFVKYCNFTFFYYLFWVLYFEKYNFARKKGDEWRYFRQYMKKNKEVKEKY